MTIETIKHILNSAPPNYSLQRVLSCSLSLLHDSLQDDENRKHILKLYGVELLQCLDDLTP